MDEFWKEAALVTSIKGHANIVQTFGVCFNPLCLIIEFLEGGDLRNYLNCQEKFEHEQALKWIQGIARGKKKSINQKI